MLNTDRLTTLQQNEYESAARANELSTEYTKNLNAINGRVVVIAVGSASLLFTFIGVLFGSQRETSALEYKYVVLAVIGFLLSSGLLLASGWFASLFRFNMAMGHNLRNKIATRREEIQITETGQVAHSNGAMLEPKDIELRLKTLKAGMENMHAASKKCQMAKTIYQTLYRISLLSGYLVLIAAYSFTLVFFLGIIEMINH